jgi:hypothetical protein
VSFAFGQGWLALQPVAHAPLAQILPDGQSLSLPHSWHWCESGLQMGVGAAQSLASSQPAPHFCVAVSQY